uniref:Uncharacterized protein n=1 Tax=archaeon enrichment culture clone 1(2010) TaxID=795325 RepID=D9CGC9_9ARCH|nr:hypothetical protein pHA1_gp05 [archaeon enrichment culture clone 1(2010)]
MYILIFNPVSGHAYYLKTQNNVVFSQGTVKMLSRMVWSNNDKIESGIHRVYQLLEKWYNIHIKLMKSLFGMRFVAEWLAPYYLVEVGVPTTSVTVDIGETGLTVFWGDLAEDKEEKHVLHLVTLFKDPERLQRFLGQESVFAEVLVDAHMEYKAQVSKFTETYEKIIDVTNQLLQEIINKLPGSYEIIEDVLSKFNVTGKDVIEYATEEATAKWIIAKLQEQLAQAQSPPAQAKAVTQAKT